MSVEVVVNGRPEKLEVAADTPLLWALREQLQLTGTKFGCGLGLCGACTVHIDGEVARACITPVSQVAGKSVTTIEGLALVHGQDARGKPGLHPVQQAWLSEQVAQCGYCQSGQIMGAAALLALHPAPTDDEIAVMMSGHLCRCGTYPRIRGAIQKLARRPE
jgi:isoquinoline 1-oxidoreductase subunit alpha